MKAQERRQAILHIIQTRSEPITASVLAEEFNVSRQVIVGDIALLRANHHEIIASNQGYFMAKSGLESTPHYQGKVVCLHRNNQTRQELDIIIQNQGQVVDVQVDHPIYGVLSAGLHLKNPEDIDAFMTKMAMHRGEMLSSLTDGIHIHTILTPTIEEFNHIKKQLKDAGILYL